MSAGKEAAEPTVRFLGCKVEVVLFQYRYATVPALDAALATAP